VYVYSPDSNYYGSDSFVFIVSDGENHISETAQILVIGVNDYPYFITESLQDALEENTYMQNVLVGDVDNLQEELSLFIVSGPGWLEINGLALNGTPGSNDAGIYDVTLELSDGLSSVSLTIPLYVENSNSAVKSLIQALDVPTPDTPKLNLREEDKQEEKPTDNIDRSNYDKWMEALNLKKL